MQIPGGPPIGETGGVGQLLFAVAFLAGVVGWLALKIMERKEAKKNGHSHSNGVGQLTAEVIDLASKLADFQGRISERTMAHSEAIEQIRNELAGRPWHKSISESSAVVAAAENRLTERLDRIESRMDELLTTRKRR